MVENIKKIFVVLGILIFTVTVSFAQVTNLERLTKLFPDKSSAFVNLSYTMYVSIKDNEVSISKKVEQKIVFLEENTPKISKNSVSYNDFYLLKDMEAFIYKPKGSSYKKSKVKNFTENTNSNSNVFYDDSKEKVVTYIGIDQGVMTELNYELEITEPRLLSPIYCQSYLPIEAFKCQVIVAKGVEIGFETFNIPNDMLKFTKVVKGNTVIYTWVGKHVKEIEYESNGPDVSYYMPQIHVFVKSAVIDNKKKEYLGTVDHLHKWYRSLIKEYAKDEEGLDELKVISDSLTKGITDDLEKVRQVYYWVQNNIKYVAFEDNLGGFVPRPPGKVCSRRFGDCKDMASIIKQMLAYANVEAHLTWIGTRKIPFTYEEAPTPSVDNHMIATYISKDDDRVYFLDATANYMPLGLPSGHIQGKQAMVSLDKDNFKLIDVPVVPASKNMSVDSNWLHIESGNLIGKAKGTYTGYYRNYMSYNLNYLNKEKTFEYFKSTLEKGSNKFKLIDYKVNNLENVEKPLVVDYNFSLKDYVQYYQDEIYVNLNLYNSIGTKIKDDRELGFKYGFRKDHRLVNYLKIPDGYKVTYLPENYIGEMKDFSYNISYEEVGKEVVYKIQLKRTVMMMDKRYFEDWNELFSGINKAMKESIVLKKIIK